MKYWNYSTTHSNSHSSYRLCPTMRPNILWRSNSHHKPTLSYPYIGTSLVKESKEDSQLTKLAPPDASLSFYPPVIISAKVVMHLLFLQETGSNKPSGILPNKDKIPFHHYYTDIPGILLWILVLSNLVLFSPDLLGDLNNYTPANLLNTPPHIKLEWYFLFTYSILCSIPNKLNSMLVNFLNCYPGNHYYTSYIQTTKHNIPASQSMSYSDYLQQIYWH